MRPALTFSTRRAKSSTCILKQCRSYLTTTNTLLSTTATSHKKKVPQVPPLWFLVARSSSSQALLKEEVPSSSSNNSPEKQLYSQFHPRAMNKDVNLDSLLEFLSKSSLSPKNKFKSLRTALYNTTQYDSRKAWLIYDTMVRYQVDKYLKLNHYGFLLCILKYGDSIQHMLTVIENMKKLHPRQDKDIDYHISQVLFSMGRQGLVEEACHLVSSLSAKKDFKPSANHYHSLAIALKNSKTGNNNKNSKSIETVTKLMLEGMEQHEIVLHNTTLSTMISVLSSSQQKDLTLQFLKAMDKANNKCGATTTHSHPYNVYIYTSLIAGFARQGDSASAKRIFDEMRKHKVEPNQVTFSALMEAYGKGGDFTSAIRLLTDHQKRHRKVNNAMVTSLLVNAIRHNNLTVAENTVKFITKKKVKVKDMDSTLLTALIWVKTKLCMDEARKDFDLLYKEDKNLVNSIMVNHLITGYGLKGDKESVIQLYNTTVNNEKMTLSHAEEKRFKHHLANALFHCRDVPAAMGVFVSMRNQNVPDDVTLAMVIQGLIMNNENNLAWRLFKTLQTDGIEPNLHAYTSILKAIGHREVDLKKKPGNSRLSPELIEAAGIRLPSLDYLNSAVPSTTEALNLFRRLTGFQQPNVYTYTTLISCFAKHNISRAISIFDHMCAKGVQPTVETYTAILQGCSIFRNSQMALSVFNHMCEHRVEPNAVTWRYLLKSLLRSRVDKKQIDKIAQMAKKSLDNNNKKVE